MYSNEHEYEYGNVYIHEKGELRSVNPVGNGPRSSSGKLFRRDLSLRLRVESFPQNECGERNGHFVFTYDGQGSLRYAPRPLLDISLQFIAHNIEHVESLTGFPEQIAVRLFTAAEEKQKFTQPSTSARGLRVFSQAYGELVLKSLCLRER